MFIFLWLLLHFWTLTGTQQSTSGRPPHYPCHHHHLLKKKGPKATYIAVHNIHNNNNHSQSHGLNSDNR